MIFDNEAFWAGHIRSLIRFKSGGRQYISYDFDLNVDRMHIKVKLLSAPSSLAIPSYRAIRFTYYVKGKFIFHAIYPNYDTAWTNASCVDKRYAYMWDEKFAYSRYKLLDGTTIEDIESLLSLMMLSGDHTPDRMFLRS